MRRRQCALLAVSLAQHGSSFTPLTQYKPSVASVPRSFSFSLHEKSNDDNNPASSWTACVTSNPRRSIAFSGIMTLCGAALGPFLDSFHSAFHVLEYEEPLSAALWGTSSQPALITAWWVPELFGLAGFIIGWLYIILDSLDDDDRPNPMPPLILVGISFFTFQYWLSGALYSTGVDRTTILNIMSVTAATGFLVLDRTFSGFLVSLATAIGGPLIEVGLLSILHGQGGYQYLDKGETGFFPLWIVPVYFLGGPAVGNLSRGFWNLLSRERSNESLASTKEQPPCPVCNDSRCVPCPNCDGQGYYVTYGKEVRCTSCKGRGLVICRECFDRYDEDPNDIEAIRELMSRMPD